MHVRMRWSLLLTLGLLWSGCTADLRHIYTTGSFKAIPGEGAAVLLWAENPTVQKTVRTWLENRGLTVLDTAPPRQEIESCQGCEQKAVLSQARLLKADQVVFAHFSRNEDSHQLEIFIQSLSVQNEEDLWNGTARENFPADVSGEHLQRDLVALSCHALATVWRYRAAGYLSGISIARDYCHFQL
jgi:hypothetical protein